MKKPTIGGPGKIAVFIILIGAVAFAGCSLFREPINQAMGEYVAFTEMQMDATQMALSVWEFESGKIRTFCGDNACTADRYGPKAMRALNDLDRIATIAEGDRTKNDLGVAFTSFGVILETMGREVFKELVPKIFELVGTYF